MPGVQKKKTPYAANWKLALYHKELIKAYKIIVNESAGYRVKSSKIWINITNKGNKKKLNIWTKGYKSTNVLIYTIV